MGFLRKKIPTLFPKISPPNWGVAPKIPPEISPPKGGSPHSERGPALGKNSSENRGALCRAKNHGAIPRENLFLTPGGSPFLPPLKKFVGTRVFNI